MSEIKLECKPLLQRIVNVLGTICVWFPFIFAIILSIRYLISTGEFMFDFLLTGELFPLAFVGTGLLLLGAYCAKRYFNLLLWGIGATFTTLIAVILVGYYSGISNGTAPASGLWFIIITIMLVLFNISLIFIGTIGIIQLVSSFKTPIK